MTDSTSFRPAGAGWRVAAALCALWLAAPAAALAAQAAGDVTFDVVSPDKIDVAWHSHNELTETITIRNSGKTAIQRVSIVPSSLADPTTMRRIAVGTKDFRAGCAPATFCSFVIDVPRAAYAGTFSGAIVLEADGVMRRSVPIVVRSRGPKSFGFVNETGWPWLAPRLPAIFFWTVVAVGWTVSTLLDWWFAGGGRRRALARQLLARTRDVLTTNLVRVTSWQERFSTQAMAGAVTRWQLALAEVEQLDTEAGGLSPDDLEKQVNAKARLADCSNVLWRALTIATDRLASNTTRLLAVAAQLDAVDPEKTADLAAYRKACQAALEQAATGDAERGSMVRAGVSLPAAKIGRIGPVFMDWLHAAVAWVVVGAIAYLTFYDRAWSFGTGRDYINVLLWTLGLTQTGTQILSRAKSSFTRL